MPCAILANYLIELRGILTSVVVMAPLIVPPVLALITSLAIGIRCRNEMIVWILNPLVTAVLGSASFVVLLRLSQYAFTLLQGASHGPFAGGASETFIMRVGVGVLSAGGLVLGLAIAVATRSSRRKDSGGR